MEKAASSFAALFLVTLALATSCNQTPTRPSAALPPQPPEAPITRVEIQGPASIAPGESVQFTAIAYKTDGTTADVTSIADWQTSRPEVLSITLPGRVTGRLPGEATLQAAYQTFATREIVVLPSGTFRLVGRVTEADTQPSPIEDAIVKVIGAGAVSTRTGFDGRYRLYGVPSAAQLRVSKDGYQPVVQALTLSDHQTQNFTLALSTPRPNLAGVYTLTVAASGECRDRLPEEVWTRRYRATVEQRGPDVGVSLSGASFVARGCHRGDWFHGRIHPGYVLYTVSSVFDCSYYGYGSNNPFPAIREQIDPSLTVTFQGSTRTAMTPGNLSGALDGTITASSPDQSRFRQPISCQSGFHQFVLQR